MKKVMFIFIVGLLSTFIIACGNDVNETRVSESDIIESTSDEVEEEEEKDHLTVYTTLYPLAFLASELGGEMVVAESIIPAGSDSHSFEPTSRQMVEIAESDLFIFNDQVSESYAKSMMDALENEAVKFLEGSKGLDKISFTHSHDHDDHDHSHGDSDPHVWISPKLMNDLAKNILVELVRLMPEKQTYFNDNFDLLNNRLIELDEKFRTELADFLNRTILVTHAAYGYWERDFNLEQIAITGLSASEEPSQRQLVNLLTFVEDSELNYLLFDQNIQPRVADVIQKEADLDSLVIHNLEVLTEADIEAGEDYFTLMERNLEVLKTALQ